MNKHPFTPVCAFIIIKGLGILNGRYILRKNSPLNYYFTANHEGENNKTFKKHNRRGEQVTLRIIYKSRGRGLSKDEMWEPCFA